jgi:hypothetical protein
MRTRTILLAACVTWLALMATVSTHAFSLTRYNDLTFSGPVALPGMTLGAGTYRFEIANPTSGANVVRVSNPRTQQVYFMRHTMRVSRPHMLPDDHIVTFGEAPAGEPMPIRIWYPRDGGDGHRFVY